jgi:hypothetical protein
MIREGDLRMWKLRKMEKNVGEADSRPAYTLNPQLVANSWVQPYVLRDH